MTYLLLNTRMLLNFNEISEKTRLPYFSALSVKVDESHSFRCQTYGGQTLTDQTIQERQQGGSF